MAYATLLEFKERASYLDEASPLPLQADGQDAQRDAFYTDMLDAAAGEIDRASGISPIDPAALTTDADAQTRLTAQLKRWNILLAAGYITQCPEDSNLGEQIAEIRKTLADIKEGRCDLVPGSGATKDSIVAINPENGLGDRIACRAALIS